MSTRELPKQIVMLAFADAQLLDVTGPLQILSAVNDARSPPSTMPANAFLHRSRCPVVNVVALGRES